MPTVIVSGALANKPFNGGNAWTRLSWVRGFERLGWDAYFVEQIDAAACVDPAGKQVPLARSVNLAYFHSVTTAFGLDGRAALVCSGTEGQGYGAEVLLGAARNAILLFNISGHLSPEPLKLTPRVKVYFDDDPGFTQFWHAAGSAGARLDGHDFYYTIGQNIGSSDCPIPTGGIAWRHTLPPVVLEDWPSVAGGPVGDASRLRFTTVASWRGSYGPVEHGGKTYGQKAHEFRKFISLPRATGQAFEIALDIHPGDARDLTLLRDNGWHVVSPREVAATPDDFRRYVRASAAEFSVAQGMYVDTRSGWFSDRTTRYLASGRPAVVQDTGFSRHVGCGEGLLPFRTPDEAVAAVGRVRTDYGRHARAARAIAEANFDSDRVIARLLDQIGLGVG